MRDFIHPVKSKSVYFERIWGGTLLRDELNKSYEGLSVGESWEVSAHPKGNSIIDSGTAKGMSLSEYIQLLGKDFYGDDNSQPFGLLIKFIGPKDYLSVQVHPDDAYAAGYPGEAGKAEAWMVIEAQPDAQLIYGTNCTKPVFMEALEAGKISDCLCRIPVKIGDVLNIPAGMIHALTPGVIVYEIQQSSDTTYRVYDWDRVDEVTGRSRELHLAHALDVGLFGQTGSLSPGLSITYETYKRTIFICNPRFTLETYRVDGTFSDDNPLGFSVWSVAQGNGRVCCQPDEYSFDVCRGDSFIVPFCARTAWRFSGNALLIKAHIPRVEEMRNQIITMGQDLSKVDWR